MKFCGTYVATHKEPGCYVRNVCMEIKDIEVSEQTLDLPDIKVNDCKILFNLIDFLLSI